MYMTMDRKSERKIIEDDLEKYQSFSSTSSSLTSLYRKAINPSSTSKFPRSIRNGRAILYLFILICFLRIIWLCTYNISALPASETQRLLSKDLYLNKTENDTLLQITNAYQQRLSQLHKTFLSDSKALHEKFNFDGNIPTFEEYQSNLFFTYQRYFATQNADGQDPYDIWKKVSQHLNPFESDKFSKYAQIPKIISSSAKDKAKAEARPSFMSWKEKNQDWRIDLFDDTDADKFINQTFTILGRKAGKRSYMEILSAMPKDIMRVDTYRYFKIFFDGGLYVDSDTNCRKSIQKWPGVYSPDSMVIEQNDFILRFLASLDLGKRSRGEKESSLLNQVLNAFQSFFQFVQSKQGEAKQLIEIATSHWNPPSLIMALEEDSFLAKEDWVAMTFARPIQVTQWAFMAQPFHPVFLDALGTILKRTEHFIEQKGVEEHNIQSLNYVLEWTGPGMLTDAVLRYLGAVHGIHPDRLLYNRKGIRLGDVLMYPHMSFRSPEDSTDSTFVIGHSHLHEWW